MTDRDIFAAAALTGLLADDGDRTECAMPSFAARAYEWADAMLRERERTSPTPQPRTAVLSTGDVVYYHPAHDAVPEACVQQSTREPERSLLAQSESVERGLPRTGNTPALTDEEREAIECFAELRKPLTRLTQSHNREKYKRLLCGLLERLK